MPSVYAKDHPCIEKGCTNLIHNIGWNPKLLCPGCAEKRKKVQRRLSQQKHRHFEKLNWIPDHLLQKIPDIEVICNV